MAKITNYNSPPIIRPVDTNTTRPLWSVMIPAYNCIDTLRETILSVVSQDPGEDMMQIEVVDDASTDGDVHKLVEELGKGRIGYFRQKQNVGSLANFETCLNRSRGRLIHILHGDDRVKTGYYEKIGFLFDKYPEIGAAFCPFVAIDEKGNILWHHGKEMNEPGILQDWLRKITSKQRIQYCTITVRRSVYEKLGGFYGVTYGEDWEMWVRIAAHYDVAYTPEALAEYRIHTNSISHRAFLNANHVKDMRWVMDVIEKWVPEKEKRNFKRNASRNYAEYSLVVANRIWHKTGSRNLSHRLTMEGIKLYLNKKILLKAIKLYIKMIINRR